MSVQKQDTEFIAEENKKYLHKMSQILLTSSLPSGITKVLDFLYLGGEVEAATVSLLKENGITHVINCAASYIQTGPKFYDESIKKYVEFKAEDTKDYKIMQHFSLVYDTIEDARKTGGKVFIHCIMGINRSTALVVAYIMMHNQCGPISANRFVKKLRKGVLSNIYFREQLIEFSREHNLLHLDSHLI